MRTAHGFQKDALREAIGNVDYIRDLLKTNDDNFRETELLYNLKSLLMELNKYIGGDYLAPDYISEKCATITRIAEYIHQEVFRS